VPEIEITLQSQSPDPVEPGQILTVKFKVENTGEVLNKDTIVELLPSYPFTLYGDVATKNAGKLLSSNSESNAVVVQYKVKVDEDAVEGDNELELRLIHGSNTREYTNNEFLIDVQTHDAVLDITKIEAEPVQIPPGLTSKVTVSVKNQADSLLKDINFELDFSASTLPLAPYQSSSQRRISQLKSKFQDSLAFTIIADPSATPGLYKIPMNITYNDEKGRSYTSEDVLAVTIGDEPQLKPYIKKSTTLQSESAGKITIGLANSGTTDVKFVEMTLVPDDSYKLVSTSNFFYIGDVDSDDTESEEIELYIEDDIEKLQVPVKLKFFDANNKKFTQQTTLTMDLFSSRDLKKFGVIESNNTWVIFLLLIAAGVGFYFYRRRSSAKK